MANTYINRRTLLPLLVGCLFLIKINFTHGLVQISQPTGRNGSVRFIAVGDWGRKGASNQTAVARAMGEVGAKQGIDFVVSTGDNFYENGLTGVDDPAFAQSFSKIYSARSLQKPWYSVLGNHDYRGNTDAQINGLLKKRDKRWNCQRSYIVRAGFVHIFFVDTTPFINKYFDKSNVEARMMNWKGITPRGKYTSNLLKDLRASIKSSNAVWKIVVGHHPIRSVGYHGDTEELVQQLLPILKENKIPLYINGHEHCLERISDKGTPNIEFLTSGGGSAAWRNVTHHERHKKSLKLFHDGQGFITLQFTPKEATVIFYDGFGKTLHSFNVRPN